MNDADMSVEGFEEELPFIDENEEMSDEEMAQSQMGSRTLESIASNLPLGMTLLHAELVLRRDLRRRYLAMKLRIMKIETARISERRRRRASQAGEDELCATGGEEIVFHGTDRDSVEEIVRSGFKVPCVMRAVLGDHEYPPAEAPLLPWEYGIDCTPHIQYALSCAKGDYWGDFTQVYKEDFWYNKQQWPGHKVLVCATVMGRRFNAVHHGDKSAGFNSIANTYSGLHIVYHPAQILPLYVLHLTSIPVDSLRLTHIGLRSALSSYTQHDDIEERAQKTLPFGFGGSREDGFVVEAVGALDEDEESSVSHYEHPEADPIGEYQDARFGFEWIPGYDA